MRRRRLSLVAVGIPLAVSARALMPDSSIDPPATTGADEIRLSVMYTVPGRPAAVRRRISNAMPTELYRHDRGGQDCEDCISVRRAGFDGFRFTPLAGSQNGTTDVLISGVTTASGRSD